jgi:DNA-binding response OmpR family regulator
MFLTTHYAHSNFKKKSEKEKNNIGKYSPSFYDLLLLEVCMPKMNGFELYRQMRKIDSKVKVMFYYSV